tara:strand:- start:55 stop:201 length:147 start_codon:yes stop_codon:yes gene_type:complete
MFALEFTVFGNTITKKKKGVKMKHNIIDALVAATFAVCAVMFLHYCLT